MVANPTPIVEIAFGYGPLDTAPVWTDVTAYVRNEEGIRTSSGRGDEFQYDAAGLATFTLSNRDRRFDPLYASGPYYGKLVPNTPVRIRGTFNAVTYNVWRGFITGWPQSFGRGGLDATVDVDCIDALGFLAQALVSYDPQYLYVRDSIGALGMVAGGFDGTTWTNQYNVANSATVAAVPGPSIGSSLSEGLSGAALSFAGNTYLTWSGPPYGSSGAVSVWINTTTTGGALGTLNTIAGSTYFDGTACPVLGIDSRGCINWRGFDYIPGSAPTMVGNVNVADGHTHHVLALTNGSTGYIYVDGVLDVSAGVSPGGFPFTQIGGGVSGHFNFTGTMQGLVLSNGGTYTFAPATLYKLGAGNFVETSASRLGRLLDTVSWPSSWRSITTSSRATVGQLIYDNQQLISAMQAVDASEQGRLHVTNDGKLRLYSRYAVQEVTRCSTSQATFSDDGTAGTIPYSSFAMSDGWDHTYNTITVTTGDGSVTASDATSVSSYGTKSTNIDTILSTLDAANQMAKGLVYQRKTPQTRIPPMTLAAFPLLTTTTGATLLSLELHDRVTVKITPMGVGSQVSLSQQVERIEWSISQTAWTCRVTTSPVRPAFAVWNTDKFDTGVFGY